MLSRLRWFILALLFVQIYSCGCSASVYVSGGGIVSVVGMTATPMVDTSGVSRLRVELKLSSPYVSEYDCQYAFSGMGSEVSVKFDNLTFDKSIVHALIFNSQIADNVSLRSDGDSLMFTAQSANMVFSDAKIDVLPRGRNDSWRIVMDLPLKNAEGYCAGVAGIKGRTIVIDPGHGGSDKGAIGADGTFEKSVNLAIALKLKSYLEAAGARPILTRVTDKDVAYPGCSDEQELSARVSVASKYKAEILVSIHNDAYYNRESHGTATYYTPKGISDMRLATDIQKSLVSRIGLTDKGVRRANFYVLRKTVIPAALVEVAFISNRQEEQLLSDQGFQQRAALGIFNGINNYFNNL